MTAPRLLKPLLLAAAATLAAGTASAAQPLLNVSYDVARGLYKELNPAFAAVRSARTWTMPRELLMNVGVQAGPGPASA